MFTKKLHKYSALSLGLLLGTVPSVYSMNSRDDGRLKAQLRRHQTHGSNSQAALSNTDLARIVTAQQRAASPQPINVLLAAPKFKVLCLLATLGVALNLVLPACASDTTHARLFNSGRLCNKIFGEDSFRYSLCMQQGAGLLIEKYCQGHADRADGVASKVYGNCVAAILERDLPLFF